MNIEGFHIKDKVIVSSKGDIINSPPYLIKLLNHSENTIQTFYHLESCVNPLLDLIGLKGTIKEQLIGTTELITQHYKYRYIKDKFFSIRKNNHHMSYFCNISQYFTNFDLNLINQLENENEIDYCLRLALKAKESGELIYRTLTELGLQVNSLTSLSRIAENNNINLDSQEFDHLKRLINNHLKSSELKFV